MPPKRKDDIKRVLVSGRIDEALDMVVERICVEERGKKSKQEVIEEALREYVLRHYKHYYDQYTSKKVEK